MSTTSSLGVKELNEKIEDLQHQLAKSRSTLKAVKQGKKKKKQMNYRKKGFDTQKWKPKKGTPGVRPTKKASKAKKLGQKEKKKPQWKPPPIFAQADESEFVFQEAEANALKKKIYEHLKTHIDIKHTASATTIDQMIEAEMKRDEAVSSVFLVNIGWIVDKYLQWKYLMPRVMPFYAVKSNPDINLLRTLKMLGAGFDCASEAELTAVIKLGAQVENMIFANPCKGRTHIRYAKAINCAMMTFDNVDEVDKIMSIYPGAKLVLRILPDDKYSLMPFGKKFGASWEEAKMLVHKCIAVKANLIGVSFHVGSGCFGTVAYEKALQLAREVFDYAAQHGIKMTLLDIGGGYPGTDDGGLTFPEIAKCVSPLLDQMFPRSEGVRIIGEPGRYFCAGSSTLAVVVNAKRKKKLVLPPPEPESIKDEQHADLAHHDEDIMMEEDDDDDDHDDGGGHTLGDEVAPSDEEHAMKTSASAPELLDLERLDLELNRVGLKESHDPYNEDGSFSDVSHTDDESEPMRHPQATVSTEHEFLYYLSDGVYGSFNNIIFDHAKPLPVVLNLSTDAESRKHSLQLYKSRLFGPTCDSIDVICDCVELPELNIGDWLLFPQMGAYTVAAASSFNGFAPPNSTYIMSYDDVDETSAASAAAASAAAATLAAPGHPVGVMSAPQLSVAPGAAAPAAAPKVSYAAAAAAAAASSSAASGTSSPAVATKTKK